MNESNARVQDFIALKLADFEMTLGDLLSRAEFQEKLGFIWDACDTLIIRAEAKKTSLTVSDEELQDAADAFRAERNLLKAADLLQYLSRRHLSVVAWESGLEDQLLTRKMKALVTDSKADEHFARNILEFESVEISQILVSDEGLAMELRAQLVEEDADFHLLARQHSIDSVSRPRGGYLGFVRRKDLSSATEAAVFGASVGSVKGPFKIESGWQLVKVESSSAAKLDEGLRKSIADRLFEDWLDEKRKKARVEVPFFKLFGEDET